MENDNLPDHTMTEIEHKNYLLEIQEKTIAQLQKKIEQMEKRSLRTGLIAWPFVLAGVYFIVTHATRDHIYSLVWMPAVILIVGSAFALLVWLLDWIWSQWRRNRG